MTIVRFGEFTIDQQHDWIEGPDGRSPLRHQVKLLVNLLIKSQPIVVSQAEIMATLWPDTHVKDTAVAQVILELRQALAQAGCDRNIVATVPRQGYRWTRAPETAPEPVTVPPKSRRRWLLPLAGLLLIGAFLIFRQAKQPSVDTDGVFDVAMMPFQNNTGNAELAWFELGFPDVIGQVLHQDPNLNVIPIADVLRSIQAQAVDLEDAKSREKLRKALGADLLVRTSIAQSGDNFDLNFSVARADKPTLTWQVEVSRPWDVAQALAEGLRQRIRLKVVLATKSDIMGLDDFTTQAFANGIHFYNLNEFAKALPYFEVVLNRDPNQLRAKLYLAQCALKMSDYATCEQLSQELTTDQANVPDDIRRLARHLVAEMHFDRRQFDQALVIAKDLIANLDDNTANDPDWAIRVHWLMGNTNFSLGQRQEARASYLTALEIAKKNDRLAAEANSLWYYCSVSSLNQENEPYLREALDIANALGINLLRAKLMNAMALLVQSQQRFEEARSLYEEALTVRREMSDPRGIGLGLMYLGNIESRFDGEKARQYFDESLAIFQEIEDAWNTINLHIYISHLAKIEKRFDDSIDALDEAIAVARDANDRDAFYYIVFNKVATELRRVDIPKARHYLAQIRAEENLPPNKVAGALTLEALCDYREGKLEDAERKMSEARSIEGNGWNQGFERYFEILVQARNKGERIPLPIEEDPAAWLLD